MSKIQFKRGLEADRLNQSPAFVPDAGEPIWVTDKNTLYIGDGSTEGGVPVSKGLDVLYTQTVDNPNAFGTPQNDYFGSCVAVSNNYAIITSGGEDGGDGVAYIYDISTGALLHTIQNPAATSPYEYTGFVEEPRRAAISGNYAILGAPYDSGGFNGGTAYIYNVITGALLYTLVNPNAGTSPFFDNFGISVSISGNYVIVGASEEDESPSYFSSGKAYIYDISTFTTDTITSANYVLDNPNIYDTPANDNFGASVAISGGYAIVGAQYEDQSGGSNSGKAYIYDISTFTTSTITTANYVLDNPSAYSNTVSDFFGSDVAISGNYAAVGARGEDDASGTTSGKVYVYDISTFTTSTITSSNYVLDNPNPVSSSNNDNFGAGALEISGNYILVGALEEEDISPLSAGSGSGKAYLYDISTFTTTTITTPNYTFDNPNVFGTAQNDNFGTAIAISGNYIVIGAKYEDEDSSPGGNSGKAYIFKTNGQDPTYTGAEIASFAPAVSTGISTGKAIAMAMIFGG